MSEDVAYSSYKKWCADSLRHALNQTNFVTNVKNELGIDLK
jgi:hypothetical protein